MHFTLETLDGRIKFESVERITDAQLEAIRACIRSSVERDDRRESLVYRSWSADSVVLEIRVYRDGIWRPVKTVRINAEGEVSDKIHFS